MYQPINVDTGADGISRGYSPAPGLEWHWYDRRLRFYDPMTQEYLPDLVEAREGWAAERAARQAAEARANQAEEEVRQLRAKLRRQWWEG